MAIIAKVSSMLYFACFCEFHRISQIYLNFAALPAAGNIRSRVKNTI